MDKLKYALRLKSTFFIMEQAHGKDEVKCETCTESMGKAEAFCSQCIELHQKIKTLANHEIASTETRDIILKEVSAKSKVPMS